MPSGFVKLIRRLLFLPRRPKHDWKEEEESKFEATSIVPTRIKLRIVDKKQLEVKVVYRLNNALQKQLYEVDVFLFFDSLLEPVKSDIYNSATMETLAQLNGPGSLLGAINFSLAAATAPIHPTKVDEREGTLVQQMRLQACMFRAAMRKSTGRLLAQLRRTDAGDAALCVTALHLAAEIALLAGHTCAAVEALQQVCAGCCGEDVPEVAAAAWTLVDEYVLSEAARSLLKLLAHADAALAALPPPPLGPALAKARDADSAASGAQSPLPVRACEETARHRGYAESLPRSNEAYTNRITVLKRHARAAIVLHPLVQRPSNALADAVGMVVAGTAMGVALVTTWAAQRSSNLYGVLYCMIIIVGYILKDRMKEWGKRYLQPCAEWFGFRFPDRIVRVEDQRGHAVGRCEEKCTWKDEAAADARVREARFAGRLPGPKALRAAIKPERVLCYSRRTTVAWDALDPRLQGVRGLSDILRLDLDHWCRHMQPPTEPHLRLVEQRGGGFTVDSVECPRVYHLNMVLRVRSRAAAQHSGRLMQLDSARIVANQMGILRLEPTGSGLLSRPPPPRRLASLAQPLASLARISATTRTAFERALDRGHGSGASLPPVAELGGPAPGQAGGAAQGGAGGASLGSIALALMAS
ncbi:hypothetical protein WJX81_003437 [Elliptochloris bilobata]|uniref:Uncharacterized protein n=1 Tax=Elliptochloris bilobata TaxID=381761 RepID=A0AAW1Q9Q3_9CHLO